MWFYFSLNFFTFGITLLVLRFWRFVQQVLAWFVGCVCVFMLLQGVTGKDSH